MARILRGEIRWRGISTRYAAKNKPNAVPVLVLSHDVFNERSGTVIAIALTSQPQRAGFPLTFELHSKGLPKKSWVKISQIRHAGSRTDRSATRQGEPGRTGSRN